MIWLNENNAYAAQWLRNLIEQGHLPHGRVDDRSILAVRPADLDARQCHFFAGIGGWPYALDLAGWPRGREVWTASLPCQPLSVAGQRKGALDERHLWPAFHALVAVRRPAVIFGEQVASQDGREWLAAVRADLEGDGYAVGTACLPACSVGAPHRRYRLYWVAHADGAGRGIERGQGLSADRDPSFGHDPDGRSAAGFVADAEGFRPLQRGIRDGEGATGQGQGSDEGGWPELGRLDGLAGDSGAHRMADADRGQRGRRAATEDLHGQAGGWLQGDGVLGYDRQADPWSDLVWLPCRDGKYRPTQPGLFPLAHGISGRVGRLRAYGNAITPQVAAEFIAAYLEEHPT